MNSRTVNRCVEFTETYTAYGDGIVTGKDATVFIGGSEVYDFTMGLALKLELDDNDNVINYIDQNNVDTFSPIYIDTTLIEGENTVASTYMHSRFYIENVLIPDIEIL